MRFISFNILLFVLLLGYFNQKSDHQNSVQLSTGYSPSSVNVETKVIASKLEVPWDIAWGPDNRIWVTEQKGLVSRIDPETGSKSTVLTIKDVWYLRTAGLLGMALHPDMKTHPYVFLNYTFLKDQKPFSRLVRYTFKSDTLLNPKVLMEIAAANGHSGSRLTFHKGKLFWATGDAASTTFAQDPNSPNGKILRVNIDGSIPTDNPTRGSPVWAMGFRNIQGMTFSDKGKLYTSEHGDATDDEVNLIEKTKNYGWPMVEGFAEDTKEIEFKLARHTSDPMKSWTPTTAPAGIEYYPSSKIPQWRNSLLMVSLKGKSLRSLKLSDDGDRIINEEIYLENQYGRLRDVCVSPAGDVYVATSNRDWNRTMGDPMPDDDRIIRLRQSAKSVLQASAPMNTSTATLYQQYCASCHKADGTGLKNVFPALKGSELVKHGGMPLISKILKGSTGPATINGLRYDTQMPSFAFLKDEELIEIVTFIRSMNFMDNSALNADMVKRARTK